MKAWLAEKGQKIPRTHSMADLLTLIPGSDVAGMAEEIILLNRFYIPTCYPDALPGSLEEGLPNEREAQEAFDIASKVLHSIGKTI